ncbi:glycerate kinase type-2 family protein [Sneathiella aquimaris]|uniref:glycerate kinase type-2 family protein n=1 Tax=Sneathiella aquimaris TaxID=2599305 RepID=UPI00146AF00A|nr:glycerate kinase [Sneathiella aquimaris]
MTKVIDPDLFLRSLFDRAVDAALPSGKIDLTHVEKPKGKVVVIAAGKAGASMAAEVEKHWPDKVSGIALTRYEHGLPLKKIRVIEAGHPVPDEQGEKAAREILALAHSLTENDLLICLISGGGSALLSLPAGGIDFAEKKKINKALLKSGATISEINTVRKKLSAIKGGRLAVAAWPAKVMTYMISDVPQDDPSVIASGPTVPDTTSCVEALRILDGYQISVSQRLRAFLEAEKGAPPDVSHPVFDPECLKMIATPQVSLQAAAQEAREHGIEPLILGDSIEGEARDAALFMAGIVRQIVAYDEPVKKPCVILSGGETTVTVSNDSGPLGRGGRNAEFLLAFCQAIGSEHPVYALAADTDGIDGTEDNAGAICRPDTIVRAARLGLKTDEYLKQHNAYGFFQSLNDLIFTGPTRTNVNDFRAILILPE